MKGIDHGPGGTTFTGTGITLLQLITLLKGMRLEAKGLKLCRGPTCYARTKQLLGFRGSRDSVYEQLLAHTRKALVENNASKADVDALCAVGAL